MATQSICKMKIQTFISNRYFRAQIVEEWKKFKYYGITYLTNIFHILDKHISCILCTHNEHNVYTLILFFYSFSLFFNLHSGVPKLLRMQTWQRSTDDSTPLGT